MKPIDSPQDRAITVRAFINARYNKLVRITDYSPMVTYLNGKHIEVLYEKLPKTATKQGKWVSTGYRDGYYEAIHIYDANDAEMYFEWLISTVQGSQNSSDEIRAKEADVSQLENEKLLYQELEAGLNNYTDSYKKFEDVKSKFGTFQIKKAG